MSPRVLEQGERPCLKRYVLGCSRGFLKRRRLMGMDEASGMGRAGRRGVVETGN